MAWASHPVELGPGHRHAAVVLQVAAAAVEELLRQEHQVLLGQAPVALHLSLELHVEGLAQLRPQYFVGHGEWHPALGGRRGQNRVSKQLCDLLPLSCQRKTVMAGSNHKQVPCQA